MTLFGFSLGGSHCDGYLGVSFGERAMGSEEVKTIQTNIIYIISHGTNRDSQTFFSG